MATSLYDEGKESDDEMSNTKGTSTIVQYVPKKGQKLRLYATNPKVKPVGSLELVQEYLTWSDLTALDSSPSSIRSKFASIFGETPDGIALNDTTYYNAVTPAITQQYGHYCYKTLGTPSYGTSSNPSTQSAVVGSNTAVNDGDSDATMSVTVTGSWSDTNSWTSSVTAGMSFSAGVTLEGIFSMGMSFSISATTGQGGSKTFSRSQSTTISVTVPAKSKKTVTMVADFDTETMNYSVPIQVSGMFGANFPSRVDDHYFWFESVGSLCPKTSGNVTGVITGVMGSNVQTKIGAAVPID